MLNHYGFIALLLSMVMFGLIAHWLACFWFWLGWDQLQKNSENVDLTLQDSDVSWILELSKTIRKPYDLMKDKTSNLTQIHGGPTESQYYLSSIYFTLSSLTSIGFGNIAANTNNEKMFSCIVMFFGALMHAVVFGHVTAIIQRMYARRSTFDQKLHEMKDFIAKQHLPKELKMRIEGLKILFC